MEAAVCNLCLLDILALRLQRVWRVTSRAKAMSREFIDMKSDSCASDREIQNLRIYLLNGITENLLIFIT